MMGLDKEGVDPSEPAINARLIRLLSIESPLEMVSSRHQTLLKSTSP